MNTEIEENSFMELECGGMSRSFILESNKPKLKSKIKNKKENNKNHLSISYRTGTIDTSGIRGYSTGIKDSSLQLEDIEENPINDYNHGTNLVKIKSQKVIRPKKVKINENENKSIYIQENSSNSFEDDDFVLYDPRNEKYQTGNSSTQKYLQKTEKSEINGTTCNTNTMVNINFRGKTNTSYLTNTYNNGNYSNHNNTIHDCVDYEKKKRPNFTKDYHKLKKMLENSHLRDGLITEIESSKFQDYKKSKINKSFQNFLSTSPNNQNYDLNTISPKNFTNKNSASVSIKYNKNDEIYFGNGKCGITNPNIDKKRMLLKYGNNMRSLLKIQKVWRGYIFRYKLYLTLTSYYKGRAFVSHLNVIKRNILRQIFTYFKKSKLMKPILILQMILNDHKREVLDKLVENSIVIKRLGVRKREVKTFARSLQRVFSRRFYVFVIDILKFGCFNFCYQTSQKNYLVDQEVLCKSQVEFELVSQQRMESPPLQHKENGFKTFVKLEMKSEDIFSISKIAYDHEDINRIKILRKIVIFKDLVLSKIQLKYFKDWRVRNLQEKYLQFVNNSDKKAENLKRKANFSIEEKSFEIVNFAKDKSKIDLSYTFFNKFFKIVNRKIKNDDLICRKYFNHLILRNLKSSSLIFMNKCEVQTNQLLEITSEKLDTKESKICFLMECSMEKIELISEIKKEISFLSKASQFLSIDTSFFEIKSESEEKHILETHNSSYFDTDPSKNRKKAEDLDHPIYDNVIALCETFQLLSYKFKKEEQLNIIQLSETLQIDKRNLTDSSQNRYSIVNNSTIELLPTTRLEGTQTKKREIRKIVTIVKKVKRPEIEVGSSIPMENPKIVKEDMSNSICNTQIDSIPKTENTKLTSQISISSDLFSKKPIKDPMTEIKGGIKLLLIDHKRNFKPSINLKNSFSLWRQAAQDIIRKSLKSKQIKSLFNSLEKSQPIKQIKGKGVEKNLKSERSITDSSIKQNHFKFMIRLTKISVKKTHKLINKSFFKWKNVINVFKLQKNNSLNNLKKVINYNYKFNKNANLAKYFSSWKMKSKNHHELNKHSIKNISIQQIFLLRCIERMNLDYKQKAFKKWKILSSNIQRSLILTVACSKVKNIYLIYNDLAC
jgi:hypothetical protein